MLPITLLLWSTAATLPPTGGSSLRPEPNVSRVLGPQECAECHENEFAVWKETHHELDSKVLTRDPKAREIAKALGLRRIKDDERCAVCHVTRKTQGDGGVKAIAGVSCESCHGASRDWLELHDDFGGPEDTITTETPEHRRARLARCAEAGMRHQDDLYAIASACFRCHTVGDDELLAAGHPSGAGFELVSWSQGEMRHNFVREKGLGNVPSDPERRRRMFVLGRLLQLEFALRGLATVPPSGAARPALAEQLADAGAALHSIADQVRLLEVDQALAALADGQVIEANAVAGAAPAAAERVAAAAHAIAVRDDLRGLDALDPLIPPTRGEPVR